MCRGRPPRDAPWSLDSLLASRLAKRKLKSFKEYAALYPECCWIFIGDNGQVGCACEVSLFQHACVLSTQLRM